MQFPGRGETTLSTLYIDSWMVSKDSWMVSKVQLQIMQPTICSSDYGILASGR